MAGSACSNCGKKLSCGCQRRQSNNGTSACSACVGTLNGQVATQKLAERKAIVKIETKPAPNLRWGANRYKKD